MFNDIITVANGVGIYLFVFLCVFLCRTCNCIITHTAICSVRVYENLRGCIHVSICIKLTDLYLHTFLHMPGYLSFECREERLDSNKPEAVNPDRKKAKTGLS